MQAVGDRLGLSSAATAAELDPLACPQDSDGGPLLIASASPARTAKAASGPASEAASSWAASTMRLSSSGKGMMTVVRTQLLPLSDSFSDSDSDSEVGTLAPAKCLETDVT